tara:strand:- start:24 stop:836 length:813 start_codon:yes stop_codon:yes gene_type:complete
MKKLLALSLLFGVVGCSTTGIDGNRVSAFKYEVSSQVEEAFDLIVVKNYEDMVMPYRAEALNVVTGEKFHKGQAQHQEDATGFWAINLKEDVMSMCLTNGKIISEIFEGNVEYHSEGLNNKCVLSRFNSTIYFKDEYAYYGEKIRKDEERIAEEEYQKELILAALVDRCSNFGWNTEENIASCVKQEAYRDLQIQEQEYKLKLIEQQLASASYVEEKPFFLEALDILIDEAEKKENRQLRMDIMRLKADTRSLRSQRQTQSALEALYRNN